MVFDIRKFFGEVYFEFQGIIRENTLKKSEDMLLCAGPPNY